MKHWIWDTANCKTARLRLLKSYWRIPVGKKQWFMSVWAHNGCNVPIFNQKRPDFIPFLYIAQMMKPYCILAHRQKWLTSKNFPTETKKSFTGNADEPTLRTSNHNCHKHTNTMWSVRFRIFTRKWIWIETEYRLITIALLCSLLKRSPTHVFPLLSSKRPRPFINKPEYDGARARRYFWRPLCFHPVRIIAARLTRMKEARVTYFTITAHNLSLLNFTNFTHTFPTVMEERRGNCSARA